MDTLNYKEAADFLKITEGTLRNWVSKGRITPHKIGKRVIFSREDLALWVLNPTAQADTPQPTAETFTKPVPAKPAAQPKQQPDELGPLTEWDARFQLSFSGKADGEPFSILENLPGRFVKMTPDNMRELARYLVDAATMCEDPSFRDIKHFRVLRESPKNLSTVCLVPDDLARDLKSLSLAAVRVNDAQATTPEKYITRFICDGLRAQLPIINKRLKERGKRAVHFNSVR